MARLGLPLAHVCAMTIACGGAEPRSTVAVVDAAPRSTTEIEVPRVAATPSGTPKSAAPDKRVARADATPTPTAIPTAEALILVPCDPMSNLACATVGSLNATQGSALGGASSSNSLQGTRGSGSLGPLDGNPAGASTVTVKGPRGNAEVTVRNAPTTIANASSVVAGMRAGFRRCYNRGLTQDPNLAGIVEVDFTVAPDGSVTSTAGKSGNTALSTVVACARNRVQSAQFAPSSDGKPTVVQIAIALSVVP